jgi:acetate kinase
MSETILVVNAGSSSIKFQLFEVGNNDKLERRLKGQVEGVGTQPRLVAKGTTGKTLIDERWPAAEVATVPAALDKLVGFLRKEIGSKLPVAVGHRVAHGGTKYSEPVVVTSAVLNELERLNPLAPLHQPNNIAPIRAVLERQPGLLQVACFDTAFHRNHPEVADRFAIPETLYDEGVRRYGFHGLSYEYIAKRLHEVAPEVANGRVVVAHLGSGASMCAISAGKSLDCTMGFTAVDGLPMGTRAGQIDAGVVLYLMNEKKMSAKMVEHFLYHDCGLLGLSGISNDVRELLASPNPRAKLALDYFIYKIVLFTGMLTAAMNGIDGFVFTAGIGENAPAIREAVVKRLSWLGLDLDSEANAKGELKISTKHSPVACYVIPTDEELMIANHTLCVLREQASTPVKQRRA